MSAEQILTQSTNVVATTAVTLPIWWPAVEGASGIAVTITPLLGAFWLLIQIYRFFFGSKK